MGIKTPNSSNIYGNVFNIQRYSVHDGPGIRTIVFLKGCPLKCAWCSNPESQKYNSELAYKKNKCIGTNECAWCMDVCPTGALSKNENNIIEIDRDLCEECFKCEDICPANALHVFGKMMSVDEVLEEVEKDSPFYSRSGGGLTVSGGDALVQPDFTAELFKEAKRRKINTTIETSGYGDWGIVKRVCANADNIFYDIKCMDSDKHKQFTGVPNEIILNNFKNLCETYPDKHITVRTPVIPGFNNTSDDINAIIDFIKDTNVQYELLAYHRLGEPKYEYIGREYPLCGVESLNKVQFEHFNDILKYRLGR